MALAKMSFDELNQLVGYKVSEPYEEYYEPMQISREQKRKRIELAERLDEVFLAMLMECFYAEQLGTIVSLDIVERTRQEYRQAVSEVIDSPEYEEAIYEELYGNSSRYADLDNYIINHGTELITTTLLVLYNHRDDPYYYSADRARAIAEGDSNSIWNNTEYEEAVKSGRNPATGRSYKYKTWHTIMDGHERDSHAEVNGITLPIGEPFTLRGGQVQYPRDDSMSASDEEICGCRCSLTFS